jgi:cation/acetate symporter
MSEVDFFCLTLCLMVGTASLPHVLMRYFTTPSVRGARRSVTWSLFFILMLYLTAPAYAAFSKLEVYTKIIGQPLSMLPKWVYKYGEIGLTEVCGKSVTSLQEAQEACNPEAIANYLVKLKDLKISKDAIVIATPEIAGLPYVIAGLVSAGGLAASLSTADGLLLAISNALSHDVYYRLINEQASPTKRMLISRCLLIVIAILAALVASTKPSDILSMVAWAFSLAASGNFPALALGIWWRRANAQGAVMGIICGYGLTLTYLIGTQYGGWELWLGVSNTSAAIFGLPVGFAANIITSLLTPEPPQEVLDMVDGLRDFNYNGDTRDVDTTASSGPEEVERATGPVDVDI